MVYRTVPFSMTFKDSKPRFQGQSAFQWPTSLSGYTSVRLNVEIWLCHGPELNIGRRSFHVAAPVVWNALSVYLRSTFVRRGQ